MKKTIFVVAITAMLTACGSTSSTKPLGMVAQVQMDEPLEGICNNDQVYHLSPLFGENQVEAVCPVSEDELAKEMNATAALKDNTTLNAEGMLGMFINCEGELVQVKIDKSTGDTALDGQLEEVVAKHKNWKAGTLNGKHVDSHTLMSFTITEGTLTMK